MICGEMPYWAHLYDHISYIMGIDFSAYWRYIVKNVTEKNGVKLVKHIFYSFQIIAMQYQKL